MNRYWSINASIVVVGLLGTVTAGFAQSGSHNVLNVPLSANEWVTRTTIGADGTVSTSTQQIAIARASDGTIRREIHDPAPGKDRVVGTAIILVSVLNWDSGANSAIVKGKVAATGMSVPPSLLSSAKSAFSSDIKNGSTRAAQSENSTLNGFKVVVHRSQYSVVASDPNAKARTVTSELWYSPELQVPMKSSISDSAGTTVITVLDGINLQEPDAALFHLSSEAQAKQK